MKRYMLINIVVCTLFVLFSSRVSWAITVTATPSLATVNHIVTVSITATFQVTPSCTIEANFGDGSPWVDVGNCLTTPCNLNTNYTYSTSGIYTITARGKQGACLSSPTPPDPATTLITVNSQPFVVSVNVTHPSFRIPRGMASTKNISYTFSATPAVDLTLTSRQGIFVARNNLIGEVNIPLNISIRNGTGRITEALTIPVSITKRAERIGTSRIIYTRAFSDANVSVTAQTEIAVTTEAGAEFRITRLQIYFGNKRAEITIKRNQPSPKVYADIRFTGSGLLRGYWEIDGRILANVNRHLVYGRTITIEAPKVPPFPTFDPGTHIVRFVITNPSESVLLPEAIYFIITEESRKILAVNLIHPNNNSEIEYSPLTFSWEAKDKTITYLVEFLEEGDEKPIFSAYTRRADYELPLSILKSIFNPGKDYVWRVKGFDTGKNIAGESPVYRFTFKKLSSCLPGQIVMVVEGLQKGST